HQPDALAKGHVVSRFLPANHPPREYTRDLARDDTDLGTADREHVLFVDLGGDRLARDAELARLVDHLLDRPGDRRPVDVDVEGREEDRDLSRRRLIGAIDAIDDHYRAVGG